MEKLEIRNFVIIAHIDHGKSTLADRFLELTRAIKKEDMRPQYLDQMDLERERGITVKMHPVRMIYNLNSKQYILNLIDTPGHLDFSYEVSRGLSAVEGAILLVDATKGIQAQTLTNLELAKSEGLTIIPVVNKIDQPQARVEETKKELSNLLKINEDEVLAVSAKTGQNVDQLLREIVFKVPSPKINTDKPFRALIFDSKYDPFLGVIAYIRVVDGKIKKGENLRFFTAETQGVAKELGIFTPGLVKVDELTSGEIGWIASGIKEPEKIKIGDTITKLSDINIEPLPGYQEPKPKVFVSLYPADASNYDLLKDSLAKLRLNDWAISVKTQSFQFLGRGFLVGFLGVLHAQITIERLKREFNLDLIVGPPQVGYKLIDHSGKEILVMQPSDWPKEPPLKIFEPWVELKIISPIDFLGKVFEHLKNYEAIYKETQSLGEQKVILIFEMPQRNLIGEFLDGFLSLTQGFASLSYKEIGLKEGDLVKIEILLAGNIEEALSRIVPRSNSLKIARGMVEKLKDILPPQLFEVPIQARIGGQIVARATLKAKRRDVIAPLYGGDYSRKRKLLEKQKKGKEKLKERKQFSIPGEVFLKMFTND